MTNGREFSLFANVISTKNIKTTYTVGKESLISYGDPVYAS